MSKTNFYTRSALYMLMLCIIIGCRSESVEYKKDSETGVITKDYNKDGFLYRDVYEGVPIGISNRKQSNIFRSPFKTLYKTVVYDSGGVDTSKVLVFDEQEKLRIVINYKDNLQDGEYLEYDSAANKVVVGKMIEGRMTGTWKELYPSGQIKSVFNMKNGKMHGLDSVWDKKGNILEVYMYENGEIVEQLYIAQ